MRKSIFIFALTLLLSAASMAQNNSNSQSPFPDTTEEKARTEAPRAEAPSVGGRVQFEYAIVVNYYSTKKNQSYTYVYYSDGRSEDVSSLQESGALGKLGAEGWELVSTSAVQNADSYVYFEKTWLYLKRAKR